jgi:hypothetical protein
VVCRVKFAHGVPITRRKRASSPGACAASNRSGSLGAKLARQYQITYMERERDETVLCSLGTRTPLNLADTLPRFTDTASSVELSMYSDSLSLSSGMEAQLAKGSDPAVESTTVSEHRSSGLSHPPGFLTGATCRGCCASSCRRRRRTQTWGAVFVRDVPCPNPKYIWHMRKYV